jgi:hypothetical protein
LFVKFPFNTSQVLVELVPAVSTRVELFVKLPLNVTVVEAAIVLVPAPERPTLPLNVQVGRVCADVPLKFTEHPDTVVIVGVPEVVPPRFKEPVLVKMNWHPVVPVLSAPETVADPVVMFMISFLVEVEADMVSEPQVSVPAFTFTVHVYPEAGLGIDKSPLIAREFVLLIVSTLLAFTAAKVSDAHTSAPSTVTVIPELIVTASEDVGTADPPHVVMLLQTPETEAVLAAPGALGVISGGISIDWFIEFSFSGVATVKGTLSDMIVATCRAGCLVVTCESPEA